MTSLQILFQPYLIVSFNYLNNKNLSLIISMSKTKLTYEILQQLPKAELHCHLDGFVRPETVVELAAEQHVQLPTTDLQELKKLMTAPMDCPDLPTYLQCFDIVNLVMQQPYAITRIFYEACEDAVKDGISYIELRFAPAQHTKKGYSLSQILQAAIDGCILAEDNLDITPRILCCAMRQMSPEINQEIAEICFRYRYRYVVGFDLAGPECGFPPQKHVAAFRTIRMKSISVTIHAGEAYGPESVDQAIACSAQRIGHGTKSIEDEKVYNEVINRRIPLEICMSSNVQTKAVKRIEDHPVRKMFDSGIKTCICTDNPTVSGITLTHEYMILQDQFNFTITEILKAIDFGFRSAFVSQNMRKRLRIEAFIKSYKILQKNGYDVSQLHQLSLYFSNIGLTIPPKFSVPKPNPPLSLKVIELLPKCDLDCRLVGSVPLDVLYKFYQSAQEEAKKELPEFSSFDEFKKYIVEEPPANFNANAKKISFALLQTEANIREAARGILNEAYTDKVSYMEFSFCPILHTRKGLTMEQVVDFLIDEVNKFSQNGHKDMLVKIVLLANIAVLSPIQVHEIAELCVNYMAKNDTVVGFMTCSREIMGEYFRYYEKTFQYLRANHVPVTIFAGEKETESVHYALVSGYARRIAGGFKITQNENLLNEITSHHITVLITTNSYRSESLIKNWHKSPARLMKDLEVPIGLCSIHHSYGGKSRSQNLFHLAETSGFDAIDFIEIVEGSFGAMNCPYKVANEFKSNFMDKAIAILKDNGYQSFIKPTYFRDE